MGITAYVDPATVPSLLGMGAVAIVIVLLICAAVYAAVGVVCGIVTKKLNEKKGYKGGFAWGFFLGLIGILVVALKPDLNAHGTVDLNK